MTQTYSTDTIARQLERLDLPFTGLLARALTALLTGRKASLHQIASLLPGPANAEAKRQELRRLLDQPALTQPVWARAIAVLLPKGKWVLALDRTEWKVGKKPVNVLVLAVWSWPLCSRVAPCHSCGGCWTSPERATHRSAKT